MGRSVDVVYQSEAGECGAACITMLANYHGVGVDLSQLRERFGSFAKGCSLEGLMKVASNLGLATRAVRLEVDEMRELKMPCILHWNMDHFVVATRARRGGIEINDPAVGKRFASLDEVKKSFTGVALELSRTSSAGERMSPPPVDMSRLTGRLEGLWSSLGMILVIALVVEVLALGVPMLNQIVLDDAVSSGDLDFLSTLLVGFLIVLLLQHGLSLVRGLLLQALGQEWRMQWTTNVMSHMLKLPMRWFESRHLGDIASRFDSVIAIQQTLTTSLLTAVIDAVMVIGCGVLMLMYAPSLALITIGATVMYGLLRWATYSSVKQASTERVVMAAREKTHFIETVRSMTALKLFGKEEERLSRWQNLMVKVQNKDLQIGTSNLAITTGNALIFGVESLLVLWVGAKMIMAGGQLGGVQGGDAFTIGMLIAYISYKTQFTGRVAQVIDYAIKLRLLKIHTSRLGDVVLSRPEQHRLGEGAPEPAEGVPCIELRDVGFRYGADQRWLFRGVNLKIETGKSIAIVGPSGCGKTTLLKVAIGLMEPQEGEVLFRGVPLKRIGLQGLREKIGTVMQEDTLLSGSILENISFFEGVADHERIEAAARAACVHDEIKSMPMGYRTLIGDLGSGLSGGQKQRVLIARAIYKQPSVVAMDEATSNLDVKLEAQVSDAIASMSCTRVVIAHRPQTIAKADTVVSLMGGKLLEVKKGRTGAPEDGLACADGLKTVTANG
jgi:ATP-binding cassette subfamily B protein RaxB